MSFTRGILRSFREKYNRDVVGAFKSLQDAGNLDIITSAATHGYLPLIDRDSSIYGQLRAGVNNYNRLFGRAPAGIWLPECGYRPAYYKEVDSTPLKKPGVEEFLADLGLKYFFADTHQLMGGAMVGKVAGDVVGPYGGVPMRRLVVNIEEHPTPGERTTFQPYFVQSPKVAVYGRNERTGLQVWSAAHGYPGDFAYREFHKKDLASGFQYWRVTDASGDLGSKGFYDPYHAFNRVHPHADHFTDVVNEELNGYFDKSGKPGIIVSAYDTELFGHWWFEGVSWLKEVLRRLAKSEMVELTTAREYLENSPPEEVISLPESSWGLGGGHYTWSNDETAWMWPLIHNAERQMERIVARYPAAEGDMLAVVQQAARELLLLESSDWPFLISTGQARDYAGNRFQGHLARFNHLGHICDAGEVSEGDLNFLNTIAEMDNPFPDIDYRAFAEREGKA